MQNKKSVDAALVPAELNGFHTIFSAFHHFDEKTASEVLQNAVKAKAGIKRNSLGLGIAYLYG